MIFYVQLSIISDSEAACTATHIHKTLNRHYTLQSLVDLCFQGFLVNTAPLLFNVPLSFSLYARHQTGQ